MVSGSLAGGIFGALKRGKDASVAQLLRTVINTQISRYGKMLDFSIDSKTKVVRVEILLAGEATPIVITVERYRLATEGGRTWLIVEAASASREWMNLVLNDFVKDRRIELPEKYAGALKLVM